MKHVMKLSFYRRFKQNTNGATAIEAAICFPLILMVFFGCFQYALYFMNSSRLTGQLDLAARQATLLENPTTTNIGSLVEQAIGPEIIDAVEYDVSIESRYGEDFADISVSYTYNISGPFMDQLSLSKSYRNSVLLFDDEE